VARPELPVVEVPCPDFVPIVENGDWTSEAAFAAARSYTAELVAREVRTIVLGCTHYPFLDAAIRAAMPWPVRLVDPALVVAEKVARLLPATRHTGTRRFEATADPAAFSHRGSVLMGFHFRAELCPVWEAVTAPASA
jgi:glutamate racemase